jgi:hypothetical protein
MGWLGTYRVLKPDPLLPFSVIAHERTHALLLSHYGILTEYFLPTWKKEGYCEYVGGHPSFDFDEGKRLIRERRDGRSPAFRYFEFYLMVWLST